MHGDGNWFASAYDGLDRLTHTNVNSLVGILDTTFRADGNRGNLWHGVGCTNYSYDGAGRLTGEYQIYGASAGTHNLYTGYGYNPAGQIVRRDRDNIAPYAYGGLVPGNRAYVADGLNRYASVGANSYGYDANGNLTSDGGIAYSYDAENRLVAASSGANLVYDPLGRLYRVYGGASDTRFLYDGDELVAEYDAAGAMLRRYVHGAGADDPVVQYEGGGVSAPLYLYADHQGSIIAVADASGTVTRVNSYDEYGVPGTANGGRFQYTGQAWIPELGMYYYKARIYAPMLGRFLQTDPIGYQDQVNLYAYVSNDPVNSADPSGMAATGSIIDGVTPNFLGCSGNCSMFSSSILPQNIDQDQGARRPRPGPGGGYRVDLPQDEAKGGHTITRHVGKSDAYLRARLGAEKYCLPFNLLCIGTKRAGSFTSLASATRLINATLSANSVTVQEVIRGERTGAFLKANFGTPTGREAFANSDRASPVIRTTFGVGVLIRHDPSSPNGFMVDTGFPRND